MTDLEKALNAYYEHFDENYPLVITTILSNDEIIDDIERCIEANEKAEQPKFENDVDY